ncbi:MAG: thioredoxin [archaeon]
MSDSLLHLDDSNFEKELKKNKILVVDFWAEWCGPCKIFGPIFEETAKENKDKDVKLAKVNVDEASKTASTYDIMSIPTIAIFKDGKLIKQQAGVMPKPILKKFIESI